MAVDCCITEAPYGGEEAGRNPVDREKQGIKRSTAADAEGIPIGSATAPANRHDSPLLGPNIEHASASVGAMLDGTSVYPDRGYDSDLTRRRLEDRKLRGEISKKGKPAPLQATVGDVGRLPTKAHFASYAGTAPVEASSGKVVRHRLSLGGNRKLNYALHLVATSQARSNAPGGSYYRKKIGEGKSPKEALRCPKRRVSDVVYKSLVADLRAPISSAA